MIESCHNCGSPWFEDYGVRCGACGAYAPGSTVPEETGEDLEVAEEAPVEPAIPSLGESQFFDASPSSTEIP